MLIQELPPTKTDPYTLLGSRTCNQARDAVVYAAKKGSARATQLNRSSQ